MPRFSKKRRQMIQLTANRKNTKKIKKVADTLQCLDDDNNALEDKLVELIQGLNDDEKEDAIKLLENMRYP
ncbi:32819_t:CDS:1, partial [Racocetra persica]